jgi:hypothetical protein
MIPKIGEGLFEIVLLLIRLKAEHRDDSPMLGRFFLRDQLQRLLLHRFGPLWRIDRHLQTHAMATPDPRRRQEAVEKGVAASPI